MSITEKATGVRKMRSICLVFGILALGCVVLGSGCNNHREGQGEIINPTEINSTAEWPSVDAAAFQACMNLDPDFLASSLPTEYLQDSTYCETDSDCYCLSGSGVPFVGCANAYHARISFAGCFACDACVCVDNSCRQQ